MKNIDIKTLKAICEKEIKNGNGNKVVFISDDDEGNGFHQLFFEFLTDVKDVEVCFEFTCSSTNGLDYKDITILG